MKLKRMPKRYLDGAPDFVLDIFHDRNFVDGISIFCAVKNPHDGSTILMVLGTNETGSFSGWSDFKVDNLRQYRERARQHRISWSELPEWIRNAVAADMTAV